MAEGSLPVAVAWFVTLPALISACTTVYVALNTMVPEPTAKSIASPSPSRSAPPLTYAGTGSVPDPVKSAKFSATTTSVSVTFPLLCTVYV